MASRAFSVVLGVFLIALIATSSSLAQRPGVSIVPTGTILNVRTTQPIAPASAQVGMRLNGVVDDPVFVEGRLAIPRGAIATLQVVNVDESSNLKGRDRITFKVHSIQTHSGTYAVATSQVEVKGRSEGKRAAKKVIGGAAIGTALGGILGGGSGAALGAVAAGGTGAAIAGSGKTHLVVPAETLLQFRLEGATQVKP